MASSSSKLVSPQSSAIYKLLIVCCCFIWLFLGLVSASQLTSNYYSSTCPNALTTIRNEVHKAIHNETRMGASLLRLHFHDCFVDGCDASILLDDTANFTGEKNAPPNKNSLRGYDVVDTIKSKVESLCPGVVSCADILAVAARDSVVELWGHNYTVLLGRRDSTTANFSGALSDLPPPTLNLSGLMTFFSRKGLSTTDLVALSGAHTIGEARCSSFRSRIYNDTNINSTFANSLKSNCPTTGGDDTLAPLDTTTPNKFDNAYYKNLIIKKGLLHSDQALYDGGSTDSLVKDYETNQNKFLSQFGTSMVKMGNVGPLTGSSGQIRTNCRKIN